MPIHDSVDRLLADWERIDPGLNVAALAVLQRIRRVRLHVERVTEELLADRGLSGPAFAVLSVLVRQPDGAGVRQRLLADLLQLSPGTVSLRVDQLEQANLVHRAADPGDRRSAIITLTAHGRRRFDDVVDEHLALQERQLAALTADERDTLAGLLRKLLVSYEARADDDPPGRLGLDVAPAHEALALQRQLGVTQRHGLLVRAIASGSAAENAGLREGDLITAAGGRSTRSLVDLAAAVESLDTIDLELRRGGDTIVVQLQAGADGPRP